MNDKDLRLTVKRAVGELGIDRPIMATRVVGGRIELHLYGGDVVEYLVGEGRPQGDAPTEEQPVRTKRGLRELKVAELRVLALEAGISGASRMKKAEIVGKLEDAGCGDRVGG